MKLSQEDTKFLKELQHKLKTQETDYQASPRFWGVMETKRIYGIDSEYHYTGKVLICTDLEEFNFPEDDLVEAKEYLADNEYCTEDNIKHIHTMDELEEYMHDILNLESEWVYYRDEEKVSEETGCFLTKEACKKHIESNHYHYKKPRTYAMTAWRNPEFERLMRIIENIEFEEE